MAGWGVWWEERQCEVNKLGKKDVVRSQDRSYRTSCRYLCEGSPHVWSTAPVRARRVDLEAHVGIQRYR
jgi:hypothetical protein